MLILDSDLPETTLFPQGKVLVPGQLPLHLCREIGVDLSWGVGDAAAGDPAVARRGGRAARSGRAGRGRAWNK